MATVQRRRTLVNPARRKRKLSPKQIAIFGTKRQKAALRGKRKRHKPAVRRNAGMGSARKSKKYAKRHGNKIVTASELGSYYKSKARRTKSRRRAAKRNPGGIVEVALLNPAPKRRKTVARRRRKAVSNPRRRRATTHRRRRTNPVARVHHRRRRRAVASRRVSRRRIRRNPSVGGGGLGNLVTSAAYAIAGAVGSKLLTQAVLGTSNTGIMGYGGNLVAAFALGKGVGMFTKNKNAQNAIILGGVIQTVLRIVIDKTPFGAQLSNIGMGDYMAQNYLTPQRVTDGLNSAALQPPVVPMAAGRRAAGAMSGIGRGLVGGRR